MFWVQWLPSNRLTMKAWLRWGYLHRATIYGHVEKGGGLKANSQKHFSSNTISLFPKSIWTFGQQKVVSDSNSILVYHKICINLGSLHSNIPCTVNGNTINLHTSIHLYSPYIFLTHIVYTYCRVWWSYVYSILLLWVLTEKCSTIESNGDLGGGELKHKLIELTGEYQCLKETERQSCHF